MFHSLPTEVEVEFSWNSSCQKALKDSDHYMQ